MLTLKTYVPYTSAIRHVVQTQRYFLHSGRAISALTTEKRGQGGRNHHGHITVRHQGGGHKQRYRMVDFQGHVPVNDVPGIVKRLEYDPNRSSFIALIYFKNGLFSYRLASNGMKIGDVIYNFTVMPDLITHGSQSLLKYLPMGSSLYNIELYPGEGSKLCRSAGTKAVSLKREDGKVFLKLPSGKVIAVSEYCRASVGMVSNPDYKLVNLGKAGRKRWLGIRPTVRGVAMNPVDHPHGGGNGRKSGKRTARSPWGKMCKGQKTSRSARKHYKE